jgi:phenylalanyl-tRNA synthetase beta chain
MAGEKFSTLDDQEHELTTENLLIADEQKGIALAGVMGGLNTEINNDTRDVLLECAYFNPTNIRATSKATRLHTDASYRFERGADMGVTDWASRRAAQLIVEAAGGELAVGAVEAFPGPEAAVEISLRHRKVNELLGIELTPEQNVGYLTGLGLEAISQSDEASTFRIPTWRVDLKRETDLIEEVCRLHGVDQIPATPPRCVVGENDFDAEHDVLAEARAILTGLGLNEAQGQTLINGEAAKLASAEAVALEHPLSIDMDVLRPSLLPGLLDSLRNNLTRRNADLALFEIGRVFTPGRPEVRKLAVALTGERKAVFWGDDCDAKMDEADLKGVLEDFLLRFGIQGVGWQRREADTVLYVESAEMRLGKQVVGELGQLQPALGKQYECRDAVLLAELDLGILLRCRSATKSFKSLPQFPAIARDVAMLVPEGTTHAAVLAVVKNAKPDNLVRTELFDVFRGRNVSAGRKSVAYAFTYRNVERTLTDDEVNAAHGRLVAALRDQLDATIRDS